MAGAPASRVADGRTDPRHRRRRETGDLSPHGTTRGRRAHHPVRVERDGRDSAHVGSGARDAPGAHRGRTASPRTFGRSGHATGDGKQLMKKILGILGLLVFVFVVTAI